MSLYLILFSIGILGFVLNRKNIISMLLFAFELAKNILPVESRLTVNKVNKSLTSLFKPTPSPIAYANYPIKNSAFMTETLLVLPLIFTSLILKLGSDVLGLCYLTIIFAGSTSALVLLIKSCHNNRILSTFLVISTFILTMEYVVMVSLFINLFDLNELLIASISVLISVSGLFHGMNINDLLNPVPSGSGSGSSSYGGGVSGSGAGGSNPGNGGSNNGAGGSNTGSGGSNNGAGGSNTGSGGSNNGGTDVFSNNPINTQNFNTFACSLEARCRAVAANKLPGHSGNTSVSVSEAGISKSKNRAAFDMLVEGVLRLNQGGSSNTYTSLTGPRSSQTPIYIDIKNHQYTGSSSFGSGTKLLDDLKNLSSTDENN